MLHVRTALYSIAHLLKLFQEGAVREARNRPAFLLQEEIRKFDRYQRQFAYMMKRRIETGEQLAMQYDALHRSMRAGSTGWYTGTSSRIPVRSALISFFMNHAPFRLLGGLHRRFY